jgi:dUTPase
VDGGHSVYIRTTAGSHCWFLGCLLGEVPVHLLVDTGAAPNVLNWDVYKDLFDAAELSVYDDKLHSAGGDRLKVHGSINLTVHIGDENFSVPFVVAELGDIDGILGMKFFTDEMCIIDVFRGCLSINGKEVMMERLETASDCCRIRVGEDVVIKPGYETVISGRVDSPEYFSKVGVTEPVEAFVKNTGVLVSKALVKVDGKGSDIKLTCANLSEKPIVVRKGMTVATLQPVVNIIPMSPEQQENHYEDLSIEQLPEHLQDLAKRSAHGLNELEVKKLCGIIMANTDVFMGPDGILGRTQLVKHKINTGDAAPIKSRPYRTPIAQRAIIDKQIDEMLEGDQIESSDSPWCSPVVLVQKKDKSFRFCIDYRKLNSVTVKDSFPIANLSDCLDSLSGSKWFSTLDLASGYWQCEVEESDRHKTAFITHRGLHQFKVLPFGLCNSPPTFQRLMEKVLNGLTWDKVLVYLDDIVVLARNSFEEAVGNLQCVFTRLREANLKLKPKKCTLFQKQVQFLGHIVAEEGISCDPEKISAVKDWVEPKTVTEVRSFLGFANYYRRFVQSFARVAGPLTDLTKKEVPFKWTGECQEAFDLLKKKLTEAPVLAYPSMDPEDKWILDTDASQFAIGAVLSQVQNGKEVVIAYASEKLSPSEANYCTTYRELLAVVTFMAHFRHYLLGRRFLVRTDHSSLRWLMNFKDTKGLVARWLMQLQEFDFSIEHRKGSEHGNADGLSRRVHSPKKRRRCGRAECDECDLGTATPVCVLTRQAARSAARNQQVTGESNRSGADSGVTHYALDGQASGLDSLPQDMVESCRVDVTGSSVDSSVTHHALVGQALGSSLPPCDTLEGHDEDSNQSGADSSVNHYALDGHALVHGNQPLVNEGISSVGNHQSSVDSSVTHHTVDGQALDDGSSSQGSLPHEEAGGHIDESTEGNHGDSQDGGDVGSFVISSNWVENWSSVELEDMQRQDESIRRFIALKEGLSKCPSRKDLLAEDELVRNLCGQWDCMEIRNGVLYRRWKPVNGMVGRLQLVAPSGLRDEVFKQLHGSRLGGHLGIRRTLMKIRQRFYWPYCKSDIERWCQECVVCQQVKPGPRYKAELQQVPVGNKLDRVALDILGELPTTEKGNKYIVVISDYYTKWTHAIALPDQQAYTIADKMMTEFISVVGVPRQIHTDQGRNFESQLFHHLCDLLGIEKTRTTPFHAQSDGQVERWNRTIQQMLKSFVNENRDDWDDHLPYLCMAYRATPHESTGCSPNLMMFGTEINLPIDIMVGDPPSDSPSMCPIEYVEWIKHSLQHTYQYANKQLKTNAKRQKHYYDLKAKPTTYQVGTYVWRWYWPAARGKLSKGWVGPFKVIKCPNIIHCVIQKSPNHPQVRVHIDALKPYYGPIPELWESQEEIILSHSSATSENDNLITDDELATEYSSESEEEKLGRGYRRRKAPERYSPW